jgi:hypothetical protein
MQSEQSTALAYIKNKRVSFKMVRKIAKDESYLNCGDQPKEEKMFMFSPIEISYLC